MESISLRVTYQLKSNVAEAFMQEISRMGFPDIVLQEKGCLCYRYTVEAPDKIVLTEKWQSRELQEEHLQTEHMKKFLELKEAYVANTKVEEIATR